MLVVGLDFETTFTDPIEPKNARVIEVGMVLWDTEKNAPIIMSCFLIWEATFKFDSRITDLTGLSEENLIKYGHTAHVGVKRCLDFLEFGEAIVAHNGLGYDKIVLEGECKRLHLPMSTKPWIDTTVHVPYGKQIDTRKLAHLGPAHGFLNPFAHRALFDVCSMLKVMSHYPFEEVQRRSLQPLIKVRALTEKPWLDGGASNNIAKERGFRYDGTTKFWLKNILADELEEEIKSCPLKIVAL